MTLTQLSYIVAVDRYRHFATAAEKSYVTQPTLSMQIHKLEEELGVTIFDRSKSPVVPTEIGERIIEQAKEMLKQSKHIEDLALINDEELKGEFRIGIIPTIAPYLLPLFLKSFTDKYPKVKLVFEEMMTNELLELLEQDQLDVGIIATPTEQSFIHEVELYYEPFVGYVSGNHPLSKKKMLHIEDLDASNLWLLNEGHCFRDQTIKLCKKHRREASKDLNIEFESGNLETLKQLVEQDFGMTLLPYLAINQIDQQCAKAYLRYFEEPIPRREVRLAYSREFLKNNIIEAFAEEIRECVPEELKKVDKSLVVE
ncbi:hydrogen peroxide-inducible genes activator [Aliifodinibius sp. S!AR15-10]|uniref:hydrogen peroxide-inducible genes activator n=1 Tax=Aliifodinibius sp. S!AR15-10 TaxID=2950437 RepID=UPI002862F666|nr:hydrogen peroxide-inducible genes activator [Aliifodinibius sp. S!AR15-10]MDR8392788.1 hydrogen peroxide-inducible genes activator [Aliifodinibius sp. S!AR15-10]